MNFFLVKMARFFTLIWAKRDEMTLCTNRFERQSTRAFFVSVVRTWLFMVEVIFLSFRAHLGPIFDRFRSGSVEQCNTELGFLDYPTHENWPLD